MSDYTFHNMIRKPTFFILKLIITMNCFLLITFNFAAFACGTKTDCQLDNGSYRIQLPDIANHTSPLGAIVYLHGWQGTAEGVMRFHALTHATKQLGVALIAPQGIGNSWSLPRAFTSRRDDIAFVENVINDAISRYPIDSNKIMISGFSLGGSMTWYIACSKGNQYAGYAPIAGAFWLPYPDSCKSTTSNIFHVHGLKDKMVPIRGRPVGSKAHQGDVLQSFRILEKSNSCKNDFTASYSSLASDNGNLACQKAYCNGNIKQLCLHNQGHSVRPKWLMKAWKQLADKNGWNS